MAKIADQSCDLTLGFEAGDANFEIGGVLHARIFLFKLRTGSLDPVRFASIRNCIRR